MSKLPATFSEEKFFSLIPTDPTPPQPKGVGEEILVVDDEEAICHLAEMVLTDHGYSVITAGNGAEAVQRYQRGRSKIQLVLTDIKMPVMDGWAVIRAIRQINPDVKIVACSGWQSESDLTHLSELKVSAILNKPYLIKSLVETVQAALCAKE